MSHPSDDSPNPAGNPDSPDDPPSRDVSADSEASASSPPEPPLGLEIEEEAPAGGPAEAVVPSPAHDEEVPPPLAGPVEVAAPVKKKAKPKAAPAPAPPAAPMPAPVASVAIATVVEEEDDEEKPVLVWYVLKVQSSREDTIRDALERRVKIQGLPQYFGRIVVPTEKTTEIRNNKKRIVERKTYPGYIMIEMELNEKTWFVVRETPGVGDFVGAHGTPTKMTEAEVNQMLGQQTAAETEQAPKVRIDVERGDRVKIKDGPFENFEGSVEEVIETRGLVKVMLIIFNRPTPVDLEYWQVERI